MPASILRGRLRSDIMPHMFKPRLRRQHHFPDYPPKKRFAIRLGPTSLVLTAVLLALLIFGVFLSKNFANIVQPLDISLTHTHFNSTQSQYGHSPPEENRWQTSLSTGARMDNSQKDAPVVPVSAQQQPSGVHSSNDGSTAHSDAQLASSNANPQPDSVAKPARALVNAGSRTIDTAKVSQVGTAQTGNDAPPVAVNAKAAISAQGNASEAQKGAVDNGHVGWVRSWPQSKQLDSSGLYDISDHLSFSNRTLINYFHMHKTGGVSTKVELINLFSAYENKRLKSMRGEKLGLLETCYETTPKAGDKSRESMWRCDFGKLRNMSLAQRASVDILMGHQYWADGCDAVFSATRDVRYFSIFRHPLPRKLSFFYHFFVRNFGKEEKAVGKDEVIRFLLDEERPNDSRQRDAGPNYYSSRLLSNGVMGFASHRYALDGNQQQNAITSCVEKLDKRFALVGLQLQNDASQCMLQKLIQVFAHAHGIDNLVGTPKLAYTKLKINTGDYPWTAQRIWKAMTPQQRQKYRQVERVDLAIYKKAVEKFKEDVRLFKCNHRVVEERFLEDTFE